MINVILLTQPLQIIINPITIIIIISYLFKISLYFRGHISNLNTLFGLKITVSCGISTKERHLPRHRLYWERDKGIHSQIIYI